MTDTVTVQAHAKLNLFLRLLSKDDDGYHSLETLFCRIALADTLTATRAGTGVAIEVAGADVGPDKDNLAVRAAQLALEGLRTRFGVHLTLDKKIPLGGGLAGGSADAAAALEAVNALAGNAIPRAELLQLASRLGSDVAFCFSGASLALGWGRGERMMVLPSLPPAPILLLVPPVAVRTVEAYKWVAEARQNQGRRGPVAMDLAALSSWGSIGRLAGNDFESPVFARLPEVRAAFEAVVGTKPLVCRMSGSGSTIFGVYRTSRDRDDAVMMLGRKLGRVIATETP
ncbi:MAG TPA: 4-(cytidine 5'-diphospho)-2-C-methyl-D-erythritol kinase [Gemmatimonadales bacterium]|nr:4-(cytidine 5'-diphospho)-2-C-methyl-D-erythritol kinase [Gemmatimonadales bacterium]